MAPGQHRRRRPRLPHPPERLRRHPRRLEHHPDGADEQSLPLHVVTRHGRHSARAERGHPVPRQPPAREVRLPLPHPSARGRRHDDGRPRRPEHLGTSDRPRVAGWTTGAGASSGTATAAGSRILRPGGGRRGVSTATGELTSDLDEDIVTAPSTPGAAPSISVYDGQSLERTAGSGRSATSASASSLATGNIDDQGQAEIIAGRVGPGASLVRIFKPDGTLVREISRTLRRAAAERCIGGVSGLRRRQLRRRRDRRWPRGAAGGRRPERPRTLDGQHVDAALPLTAPGGATAGVNLAAGYYDPVTRPGFVANLITTPASGPVAGRTQVWVPFMPDHEGAPMGAPVQIASFRPLGRHVSRGLRLQVTGSARTGWTRSPHGQTRGRPSTSRSTTPARSRAFRSRSGTSRTPAGEKGGYRVALDLDGHATASITRKGEPVRGAAVRATFTMLDMADAADQLAAR